MKRIVPFITLLLASIPMVAQTLRSQAADEIRRAEANFQKMALEQGVQRAFVHFAAPNVVVNRNDTLIVGRDALLSYMQRSSLTDVALTWKPDFADASEDGTLGYTYGRYEFKARTREGREVKSVGVFHTVWRKQPDGQWKFVWD